MGAGTGRSRALLALLAALPCLVAMAAAQVLTVREQPIADTGFPYTKCTDYGCSSAPYTLDLVETALAHQGTTRMCFRVSPRPGGCGPEPSACCRTLEQQLGKIDLSVGEWRRGGQCSRAQWAAAPLARAWSSRQRRAACCQAPTSLSLSLPPARPATPPRRQRVQALLQGRAPGRRQQARLRQLCGQHALGRAARGQPQPHGRHCARRRRLLLLRAAVHHAHVAVQQQGRAVPLLAAGVGAAQLLPDLHGRGHRAPALAALAPAGAAGGAGLRAAQRAAARAAAP
jgi:hypothetical protein